MIEEPRAELVPPPLLSLASLKTPRYATEINIMMASQ